MKCWVLIKILPSILLDIFMGVYAAVEHGMFMKCSGFGLGLQVVWIKLHPQINLFKQK